MSTEWLVNPRDIQIAADIEREIARVERPGGRIGGRFPIDYATGLPPREVESAAGPSDAGEQPTTSNHAWT
jgi:hypothetical protein